MSYHTEPAPQFPPTGYSPANRLIGTLSPQGQWEWNGAFWVENSNFVYDSTPIVEVDLVARLEDNFYFQNNPEQQYIGLYHRHEDGTLMIGAGVLGIIHEMIPDEIIFRKIGYQDIQETRERVSDIFYKVWFESNTLSEEEILSIQTTIRDGIKQTGRNEDEPLVFYKKDRNTLENRKDLEGDTFEEMCQYIFSNQIGDLDDRFDILVTQLQLDETEIVRYSLRFRKNDLSYIGLQMALKVDNQFTDILNLSQLTKPKFGNKIKPERAREVLDTNIFELLPNQTTRQDEINDFFTEFDNLIGPTPVFQDVDGDGVGEDIQNNEQDEQSRISFENQPSAFITRLDEQAEGSSINQGKTLESMRNRLNTYLGDVDNIIQTLEDDRPEYQNISDGFLKVRKPNQAIIIRAPGDDLLEFQKLTTRNGQTGPLFLIDGFTITMWVRFVSKESEGTLFNFGNPLEENGSGFRLETRTNIDNAGNYKRWIRLAVKESDGTLRDNHWGTSNRARLIDGSSPIDFYGNSVIHQLYPNVPTEDLNEWYFICATYNPSVVEEGSDQRFNKQYWLNHVNGDNEIVAFSGLGAKCKVEIISRSDLLRARGFKVDDLTVDAPPIGDEITSDIIDTELGDVDVDVTDIEVEDVDGEDTTVINPLEETSVEQEQEIQEQEEETEIQIEEQETETQIEEQEEETEIQIEEQEEASSPTITIRSSGGGY